MVDHAPRTIPAPDPSAPASRELRRLEWFLALGVAGLAALPTGLAWDAILHARDPELAHREGLFTLRNPGHLLLFTGVAGVAAGTVGAALTRLDLAALCFSDPGRFQISGLRPPGGSCPPRHLAWDPPAMLHVWRVDVPGGAFARHAAPDAALRGLGAAPAR